MKIVIVTDGPYGERAHETIKKDFECDFVQLEPPTSLFMDEVEIDPDSFKKLEKADILITYVLHPDLTLELVEKLNHKVEWIIVGAWRGEGFKNQLEKFGNVTCPENMCDLEENGNPIFDDFVSKFGKPVVEIESENDLVTSIKVLRCSPCGSTKFIAKELIGESLENLPIKAGLKIQHYPCRAPKMRLFTDDECKKEMAANFHKEAFEKSLNKNLESDS
ncbi:MAG: DUF166 family protein [Methanobacteriaceae archaeon]|nr:DUF166 family protein [Methanobacteriaceae archaeon]